VVPGTAIEAVLDGVSQFVGEGYDEMMGGNGEIFTEGVVTEVDQRGFVLLDVYSTSSDSRGFLPELEPALISPTEFFGIVFPFEGKSFEAGDTGPIPVILIVIFPENGFFYGDDESFEDVHSHIWMEIPEGWRDSLTRRPVLSGDLLNAVRGVL